MAGSLYEVLVDKMGMREVIKNRKNYKEWNHKMKEIIKMEANR
jgi:hypothetical protein